MFSTSKINFLNHKKSNFFNIAIIIYIFKTSTSFKLQSLIKCPLTPSQPLCDWVKGRLLSMSYFQATLGLEGCPILNPSTHLFTTHTCFRPSRSMFYLTHPRSSSFCIYPSLIHPPYFCQPTPSHRQSCTQDAQIILISHTSPHQPHWAELWAFYPSKQKIQIVFSI